MPQPWENAPATPKSPICTTCTPRVANAPTASERARLDAILAKKQRRELLSKEDQAFLDEMSARSHKGLVTLGAGVALTLKGAPEKGGVVPFQKNLAEVNTDDLGKLQHQLGVERNVFGGTGKVKAYGAANEEGFDLKSNVLYEQDLVPTRGARIQAEVRASPDRENAGMALKAKVQKEVAVPPFLGSGEGTVKRMEVEGYAYARLNVLNDTEKAALEARIISNANAAQEKNDARRAGVEQMEINRERQRAEWQQRQLPPPPPPVGGGKS